MKKYKYLLIFNENSSLIYGECIEWLVGEFDKKDDFNLKTKLPRKYYAKLISTPERIDYVDNVNKKITFNGVEVFSYEDEGEDLITLSFNESLFNPLIDRCSKFHIYINQDATNGDDWLEENKDLLNDINSLFNIDLLRNPELINTFSFYIPTRLSVDTYFTDKPARGENREPTNLKAVFIDEFQLYKDATYKITEYVDGVATTSKSGSISDGECSIVSELSPDELELAIINGEEKIYYSRYGFIKRICVNVNVNSGSVALENGSKVSKYTQTQFNVGYD